MGSDQSVKGTGTNIAAAVQTISTKEGAQPKKSQTVPRPASVHGATALLFPSRANGFGPDCFLGMPTSRTVNPRNIIAVRDKSIFLDSADFRPNPELQQKRVPLEALNKNRPFFQMPISTGIMNFVRTGPAPKSPNDITILVLPGVPDQNFTHFPLMQQLGATYDIAALEIPGRGWANDKNKVPYPFTMASAANAIKAAIRQLDLKNVVLMSHSTGESEALHALLTMGPEDLGVVGVISLNGWNPQLVPESLPYDFTQKLTLNSLTAGIAWRVAKTFPKKVAGETWKKMVKKDDKSLHLDEATGEWAKVFKGKEGYTISEAYNISRQEYLTGKQAKDYQKNLGPYRKNLTKLPFLFIGTKNDIVVRGPKDANGAVYAQRNLVALQELGNTNPLSQVVSPEGDHCFHFKHPGDAAAPILKWLKEIKK